MTMMLLVMSVMGRRSPRAARSRQLVGSNNRVTRRRRLRAGIAGPSGRIQHGFAFVFRRDQRADAGGCTRDIIDGGAARQTGEGCVALAIASGAVVFESRTATGPVGMERGHRGGRVR